MSEDIKWASLPLDDESNRVSRIMSPYLDDSLKSRKNMTDNLIKRLKIVAGSKLNMIMSAFGLQGSGKSYAILFIVEQMLRYMKKNELDVKKNVHFTITDLLKAIESAEKGDIFILDEQVYTTGYGSEIERRSLQNIEMTVRAEKLCFFFLAPKWYVHNYHFVLEMFEKGSNREWDWSKPIEEQWKWTKSIVYDVKEHPLGFIVTGTPSNEKLLKEYEIKKSKFIEDIRLRRGSKRPMYILDKCYELCEYKDKYNKSFLEDYIRNGQTASLKKNIILVWLAKIGGGEISIDEIVRVVHYLDYIIIKEDKFKKVVDKYKLESMRESIKMKIMEAELRRKIRKELLSDKQ